MDNHDSLLSLCKAVTYHPILRWRCTRCLKHGEVTHALDEPVDVRWNHVVVAHLEASPACSDEWGEGGIAVESEQGAYPE